MFIAYAVVAIALSAALVASAVAKLTKQPRIVDGISGLGVPLSWFPGLAAAEIAGAIGLIIGLWVPALGIAAGIGVVAYFVGAVTFHVRANDRDLVAPAVLGLVAVAATVLRLLTL
jgi:hypothetical protein